MHASTAPRPTGRGRRCRRAAAALAAVVGAAALQGCGPLVRSSIAPAPVESVTGVTVDADLSADGRFVAFASTHAFSPRDVNGLLDVYVRDRATGVTELVSRTPAGVAGNGHSQAPAISADGRYVAFQSRAGNLGAADGNGVDDVYLHDRATGVTVKASGAVVAGNGASVTPVISADGRFVAFTSVASNLVISDTNGRADAFLYDRDTRLVAMQSLTGTGGQLNDASRAEGVSADGLRIVFSTLATNATPGDANGARDVFVRDRLAGTTTLVSVATGVGVGNGLSSGGSVSADGRFVAFSSRATNLVAGDTNGRLDVFVRDLQAGTTELVSRTTGGTQPNDDSPSPSISGDGRLVAFHTSATNLGVPVGTNVTQVYVRDRVAGTLALVPAGPGGPGDRRSEEAVVSDDGTVVLFASEATGAVPDDTNDARDVFVHDLGAGTTERASVASDQADDISLAASASDDGRFVTFESEASNLVAGDTNRVSDVFVKDHQTGALRRVSESASGQQANGPSSDPVISGDGNVVAFVSSATNLVQSDTNGVADVFVKDLRNGSIQLVSAPRVGVAPADGPSEDPSISDDGRVVVFTSAASNLVGNDTNGAVPDVFQADLPTRGIFLVSVDPAGLPGPLPSTDGVVSGDGRVVAFVTASPLVFGDANGTHDVFVSSLDGTFRVSVGPDGSDLPDGGRAPAIDDTGRTVAFETASPAVAADTNGVVDVYVRRRTGEGGAGTTELASVEVAAGAGGASGGASVSDDGRLVAFESRSARLVAGDANGSFDVFVRDLDAGATIRASAPGAGGADVGGVYPALAGGGAFVAFTGIDGILGGDANGAPDVFRNEVRFGSPQ